MTTGQILGGGLLAVSGLIILFMGFIVLKAERWHEVLLVLAIGLGSLATGIYVLAS
jgi:hypothetical protein